MTQNQETMSREDFESLQAFAEAYGLMSVPLDKVIQNGKNGKSKNTPLRKHIRR